MAFHNVCLTSQYSPSYLKLGNLFAKYRQNKPARVPCKFVACKVHESSLSDDLSSTRSPLNFHHTSNLNGNAANFQVNYLKEQERKIDEIRKCLVSTDDPMESLHFVDTIQRVGMSRHFREEIEQILRRHYEATGGCVRGLDTLHDVALSFRLLRQHGHHVSPDVFKIFKSEYEKYKDDVNRDISGLMELYEATQLKFYEEHELDEAANFSRQILSEFHEEHELDHDPFAISFRLSHPYHKSIEGLPERYFIQTSVDMNQWDKDIRQLAETDLCARKLAFQQELFQISKWWKELGLASELKLARNQSLKWYTCSMVALIDDINLSRQRVELTKSIAFIYLIDDIFDLYGTLEELELFAEAVNKWDYAFIDTLPDYMKMSYRALLDTINEIAQSTYENHGHDPIDSLRETWGSLCNAFLVEAKWFASGELPTAEAYLENGKMSSGAYLVLVHLFYLLGLGATNNGAINLNDISELASSAATILRLWDDLGSAKDEHQDGKDGSYIEYYMKQNDALTVEQAREHVMDLIATAWKRLNKECFHLSHGSTLPFKRACLNLARMIPIMYNYDDNQSLPVLNEYMYFMLFDQTSVD